MKDDYDGAEPSGNSVMAIALLRLARMTDREDFRAAAQRTLEAFGEKLRAAGAGLPQMLVALDLALGKPMEIVLAGPRSDGFKAMLAAIRRRFLPRAVILRAEDLSSPHARHRGRSHCVCLRELCLQIARDFGGRPRGAVTMSVYGKTDNSPRNPSAAGRSGAEDGRQSAGFSCRR